MGDPADRQMNQENSQGNTCSNGDHIRYFDRIAQKIKL